MAELRGDGFDTYRLSIERYESLPVKTGTTKQLFTNSNWYAVYLRARHEAYVAEQFSGREIDYLLPQYKSKREWKDRTVEILMPLFPSYIFVNISPYEKMPVLEVPGVVQILKEAMDAEEIERLKHLGKFEQKQFNPQPHPFITIGKRVRVISGPLQGTEGILVRGKKSSRVVLTLDLIRKAMSVEVDANAIEEIHA